MYSVPYFDAREKYRCRDFESPEEALMFFFFLSGLKLTAFLYANDTRVFVTGN